jgi:hypothetical protein
MTSNIGSRNLKSLAKVVGFATKAKGNQLMTTPRA